MKVRKGALFGLVVIALFVLVALAAPLLAPHPPDVLHPHLRLPPAFLEGGRAAFPLGTDDVGRDTLSRLIYGARLSLAVGLLVVGLSAGAGAVLGLLSGYLGGLFDSAVKRIVDVLMAFPGLLLAVLVVSLLGPGILNAVVAVAVVSLPGFIRIVRASAMGEAKKPYVAASKSFGAGRLRIMFVEVLPNCLSPLIVQTALGFSEGVLNVAALGFLGLGARPPLAEWGVMLADARPFIQSSPWMATLPGLCLLAVVLAFNLLGDGLRDSLDPRLKH